MTKIRIYFFIFSLIVLSNCLFGCSLLTKKLESPKVKVDEVRVNHIQSGKVWLDLILKVKNPNKVDFTVEELQYALEVDEHEVASDIYKEKIKINANQETLATVPIQLKIDDIIRSALTLLTSKSLPYRARGNVKVGPFKIPFDEAGKLDISDL